MSKYGYLTRLELEDELKKAKKEAEHWRKREQEAVKTLVRIMDEIHAHNRKND